MLVAEPFSKNSARRSSSSLRQPSVRPSILEGGAGTPWRIHGAPAATVRPASCLRVASALRGSAFRAAASNPRGHHRRQLAGWGVEPLPPQVPEAPICCRNGCRTPRTACAPARLAGISQNPLHAAWRSRPPNSATPPCLCGRAACPLRVAALPAAASSPMRCAASGSHFGQLRPRQRRQRLQPFVIVVHDRSEPLGVGIVLQVLVQTPHAAAVPPAARLVNRSSPAAVAPFSSRLMFSMRCRREGVSSSSAVALRAIGGVLGKQLFVAEPAAETRWSRPGGIRRGSPARAGPASSCRLGSGTATATKPAAAAASRLTPTASSHRRRRRGASAWLLFRRPGGPPPPPSPTWSA